MSIEDAVGSVVLLGGGLYVLDKVTGKKKRVTRRRPSNRVSRVKPKITKPKKRKK